MEIASIDTSIQTEENQDASAPTIDSTHGDQDTAAISILFIGNSLTYSNDLPKLVYEYAKTKEKDISTKMVAEPNYAIIDHLDFGNKAKNEIESKKYDYVVVQQGPSSQSEGRKLLFEGAARFDEICKKNDTKLVIFMVWPSRTYYDTFDDVIKNHKDVASAYDAILCPVGQIWKAHFDATNDFSYYGSDQFHPSIKGSKEAARIIFDILLKSS